MSTLKEIIESNYRSANAALELSASINKVVPLLTQVQRDIYDLKITRELDNDKLEAVLGRINEKLAVLVDNIKDTQADLKQVQRDVTGSHILPPPEHKKPKAVEVIEAVEKLSPITKIMLFVFLIIAALSGWITHIWH